MADITSYAAPEKGFFRVVLGKISTFFAALTEGVMLYAEHRSRFAEINRLSEMTDEELAERGLHRDSIVRHVFRDRFCY